MNQMFDSPVGALALLALLLVGQFVLSGLIPLIWWAILRKPARETFSLRPASWQMFAGASLIAIGMVALASPTLVVQERLGIFPMNPATMRQQISVFAPILTHWAVLAAILIPFAAATTEEFLFRGVLQNRLLSNRRLPLWPTLWAVSLVFSLVHMDMSGAIFRTLLGLLFAWMTFYSRSLWPAIWAHFFYDAILVGGAAWQIRSDGLTKMLASYSKPLIGATPLEIWLSAGGGLVVLVVGLVVCHREHEKIGREEGVRRAFAEAEEDEILRHGDAATMIPDAER